MKYRVSGTVLLNWCIEVEAGSYDSAEEMAKDMVCDGSGLGDPVDDPEVGDCHRMSTNQCATNPIPKAAPELLIGSDYCRYECRKNCEQLKKLDKQD